MATKQLPHAFRSLGILRVLNVLAVGFALAGVSSAVGGAFLGHGAGVVVGLPTLLCGVVWAMVLRIRATIGRSPVRWSWLASVPLAAINAALACGLLFTTGAYNTADVGSFVTGAAIGASLGAIIWIPALIATLVCFGVPLWHGQMLAAKGLAGEERGERFVAFIASLMAILGLVSAPLLARDASSTPNLEWGSIVASVIGAGGLLTGVVAAVLAHLRGLRRRAFVAEVEAGAVQGYRIADAPEGRVLMRVTSVGTGYRVADFEEPVYAEPSDTPEEKRAALPPRV